MSSNNIELNISDSHSLPKKLVKKKLETIHSKLQLTKPAAYIFMTDNELLELNRSLLNHDYYTDIITLDYSQDDDFTHHEIYISVERVCENAREFSVSDIDELTRVCIHGLLHLAGHDDKSENQKKKMRTLEDEYLALYRST